MSNDTPKTERQIARTDGETPDLRGVIGSRDPEEVDIFGYEIIYTTGEFTVGRDELMAKIREVGLPEWMAPSPVKPHRAFGRMIDDLRDEGGEAEFSGHRIQFDFAKGNSRYVWHVHVKVFHSADDDSVNMTEGTWIDHELGVMRYDEGTISFIDRINEGSALAPLWYDGIKQRAQSLFSRHQQLHNGGDVNNMVYYLARQWTDSVRLRDACYFIPAAYADIEQIIDGFRELYAWIDENADKPRGGQRTELHAIEIVDSERQREMVEARVRGELRDQVGDIFDDVVDEVREGEGAIEEIADEVVESLDHVEGLAEQHSAVLKTELSVKRAVRDVLDDMDEEREEVVDRVLDEMDLAEA